MKNLFWFMLAALLSACYANATTVRFDERLEVTSVVCRLTGMTEANNLAYGEYATDVDNYFAGYRQHPVVECISDFSNRVGIRDLFELALSLEIKDNVLVVKESCSFDNLNSTFIKRYLQLLNDFYTQSNFHNFYVSHSEYYTKASKVYADVVANMDFDLLHRILGTDVSSVDILLNSFSGSFSYSFPERNIIVFSGFATHYIGNSKNGSLSSSDPCPERNLVYRMADFVLSDILDGLSGTVLPASRLYFNASASNYFKPCQLFGEYVKNLCAAYYLKVTGNNRARIILELIEGSRDNRLLVGAKTLYDGFAPLAGQGLTPENLKKFADIYKLQSHNL